jgi:hypothetical protein
MGTATGTNNMRRTVLLIIIFYLKHSIFFIAHMSKQIGLSGTGMGKLVCPGI